MHGPGWRMQALGVAGAPAPGFLTTCFQLSDGLLIDTGAAAHGLVPEARPGIREVLLTHAHLDHVLGLPFLLTAAEPCVHGLRETLEAVREDLLDNRVWPDLSARAEWKPVAPGGRFTADGWDVEAGAANHTVPCLAYLFSARPGMRGPLAVVGDCRRDDALIDWVAKRRPASCVVEAAYPDDRAETAAIYGHQTPRDLRAWRDALGPDCRILVFHIKPEHDAEVRAELEALADPHLHALRDGDVIDL